MKHSLVILLLLLTSVLSNNCLGTPGCLLKEKYKVAFSTSALTDGSTPSRENKEKIVFFFSNRLVITASVDSINSENPSEYDQNKTTQKEIGKTVEKIIFYGNILLDCGVHSNLLCTINQSNSNNPNSESEKQVEGNNSLGDFCFVLKTFDSQKTTDIKFKEVIFCPLGIPGKNFFLKRLQISQFILRSQTLYGKQITPYYAGNLLDRFSVKAGYSGTPLNSYDGYFTLDEIHLVDKNKDMNKYKRFSLSEMTKGSVYYLKCPNSLTSLAKEVSNQFAKEVVSPSCCLFFKTSEKDFAVCLSNEAGSIESDEALCKVKLEKIFNVYKGISFQQHVRTLRDSLIEQISGTVGQTSTGPTVTPSTSNPVNCETSEFKALATLFKEVMNDVDKECKLILPKDNSIEKNCTQVYSEFRKTLADGLSTFLPIESTKVAKENEESHVASDVSQVASEESQGKSCANQFLGFIEHNLKRKNLSTAIMFCFYEKENPLIKIEERQNVLTDDGASSSSFLERKIRKESKSELKKIVHNHFYENRGKSERNNEVGKANFMKTLGGGMRKN